MLLSYFDLPSLTEMDPSLAVKSSLANHTSQLLALTTLHSVILSKLANLGHNTMPRHTGAGS